METREREGKAILHTLNFMGCNMSFDWKETIGAVAPIIATALGGPLAGVATKFVANKLLGDDTANIEEILANPGPDQIVELSRT